MPLPRKITSFQEKVSPKSWKAQGFFCTFAYKVSVVSWENCQGNSEIFPRFSPGFPHFVNTICIILLRYYNQSSLWDLV